MSQAVTRESLIASGAIKPNPIMEARRAKGKEALRRLEAVMARRCLVKGVK